MTKEREALKLALEAMRGLYGGWRCESAIKACEEALAQPEQTDLDAICQDLQEKTYNQAMRIAELESQVAQQQEPACFVYPEFFGRLKIAGAATAYLTNGKNGEYPDGVERISLFRAPPQRTWVGLTDEELWDLWYSHTEQPFPERFVDFKRAYQVIEAKLKEKNT